MVIKKGLPVGKPLIGEYVSFIHMPSSLTPVEQDDDDGYECYISFFCIALQK